MWPDKTIESRWSPNIDAYRRDYLDKKPVWKEDSETLRREEMERRNVEFEQYVKRVRRSAVQQAAAKSKMAHARAHTQKQHTVSKDNDGANISFATISRIGGGAALGTAIGTGIAPGFGTIAGATLGGLSGAFAPSILSRKKSDRQSDNLTTTRTH